MATPINHTPTFGPDIKYPERTCHVCNKDLKEAVVPALILVCDKILFQNDKAHIHFCWDCFRNEAGIEWERLLLKRGLDVERERLGPEHVNVKAIEKAFKKYGDSFK